MDLETTGGNFQRDRITEIAFLHFWQGKITPVSHLVNPTIPIQAFVSQLTGIDDAMVRDAPLWPELLPDVEDVAEGIERCPALGDVRTANGGIHSIRFAILPAFTLCTDKVTTQQTDVVVFVGGDVDGVRRSGGIGSHSVRGCLA